MHAGCSWHEWGMAMCVLAKQGKAAHLDEGGARRLGKVDERVALTQGDAVALGGRAYSVVGRQVHAIAPAHQQVPCTACLCCFAQQPEELGPPSAG